MWKNINKDFRQNYVVKYDLEILLKFFFEFTQADMIIFRGYLIFSHYLPVYSSNEMTRAVEMSMLPYRIHAPNYCACAGKMKTNGPLKETRVLKLPLTTELNMNISRPCTRWPEGGVLICITLLCSILKHKHLPNFPPSNNGVES